MDIKKGKCIIINKKLKILLISVIILVLASTAIICHYITNNTYVQPLVLYVDTIGYPDQMDPCLFELDEQGVLTIKVGTDGKTVFKDNLNTEEKYVQIVEQKKLPYSTCKKITKLVEDVKNKAYTPQEINPDLYTDTLWINMNISDEEYIDIFSGTLFLKQDPGITAMQEFTYTLLDQCSEQIQLKRFLHVIRVRKGE